MASRFIFLAVLALPFFLSACGDWELTQSHFPYGNQRTAGSGVLIVMANMMPEKDVKLEPVGRELSPEVIQDIQKIFED